jgi:hypothetical protein
MPNSESPANKTNIPGINDSLLLLANEKIPMENIINKIPKIIPNICNCI